ncbi:hypothetical protein VNO80_09625 [Phaseolus coccineus]|uniref:Uncharacterized protein n=1 Tax=Phaseolus coccineus TaxID=3886 RepID=A0AAN9R9R0_PHACN
MREVEIEKTKIPTSVESDRPRSPTQLKFRGKSPSVVTYPHVIFSLYDVPQSERVSTLDDRGCGTEVPDNNWRQAVDDEFGYFVYMIKQILLCKIRDFKIHLKKKGLHALCHFKKEGVDDLMMGMQWHGTHGYGWMDDVMMVSEWRMIRLLLCRAWEFVCFFVRSYPRQSSPMPRTGPKQGHHGNFAPRKLTPPNGLTTRQPLPPNPPKSLYFRGTFVVAREQSENCKHTGQSCPLLSVTTIYFTMLDYKSFRGLLFIYEKCADRGCELVGLTVATLLQFNKDVFVGQVPSGGRDRIKRRDSKGDGTVEFMRSAAVGAGIGVRIQDWVLRAQGSGGRYGEGNVGEEWHGSRNSANEM